jgi:hypothetical protein
MIFIFIVNHLIWAHDAEGHLTFMADGQWRLNDTLGCFWRSFFTPLGSMIERNMRLKKTNSYGMLK